MPSLVIKIFTRVMSDYCLHIKKKSFQRHLKLTIKRVL